MESKSGESYSGLTEIARKLVSPSQEETSARVKIILCHQYILFCSNLQRCSQGGGSIEFFPNPPAAFRRRKIKLRAYQLA